MSQSERTQRQLELLATRFENDPNYMAWVLSTYRKQEHLREEEFLRRLDIEKIQLSRLALCRRPDPESDNFAQQARQIADYAGVDLDFLTRIIREVDSLIAMQNVPHTAEEEREEKGNVLNRTPGLLFAARDRSEPDLSGDKQSDDTIEDQQPGEDDVDRQ